MNRDELFNTPIVKQFEFDEAVVSVFDDMVQRSVPFYAQTQELIVTFLAKTLQENNRVYDLGCSTASTLLALEQTCPVPLELIGVDNSASMIEQARKKCQAHDSAISLHVDDMVSMNLEKCRAIVCNYTLQFVRPIYRQEVLNKMYESLDEKGMLIVSEKLFVEDKALNKTFIDIYYAYKKAQGYSQTQIAQKREALENVLIPYTYEENIAMLKKAGFKHIEVLFRWVNFATFIAKK